MASLANIKPRHLDLIVAVIKNMNSAEVSQAPQFCVYVADCITDQLGRCRYRRQVLLEQVREE